MRAERNCSQDRAHSGKRAARCGRLRLKCDGTRAETRFRLSAKRTRPFKSAGASVQSTTGSRGVRISGSNAGYTIRCRHGSQTQQCILTYTTVELHVSAYIEAIIRFNNAS